MKISSKCNVEKKIFFYFDKKKLVFMKNLKVKLFFSQKKKKQKKKNCRASIFIFGRSYLVRLSKGA